MSEPVDPDLLITTDEAARLCGVASSTIRNWRHRDQLPRATKAGRERLNRLGDVIAAERSVQARGQGPVRGHRRARALDDLAGAQPA